MNFDAPQLSYPLAASSGRADPRLAQSGLSAGSGRIRLFGAGLVALAGPILGVGLWLNPNAAGLGTHTQLGLGPCPFYLRYGIPCPTCGYTTAVSHVAHGQWISAILTQPAGAVVGFVLVGAFLLGLMALATGRWYGPGLVWLGWRLERLIILATVLFLGSWLYKVLATSAWKPHHW